MEGENMKKKILGFVLAGGILLSGASILTACGGHEHDLQAYTTYFLTEDGKDFSAHECKGCDHNEIIEENKNYVLTSLVNTVEEGDKIVLQRDIERANDTDPQVIYITKAITLEGEGESKPVVHGAIRIHLADGETDKVTIKNLEVAHSGEYNAGVVSQDERRGILVKNGSVELKNNYIHLENESITTLTTAPTGVQISVALTNTAKSELSYVIDGNKIGKYSDTQCTTSSNTSGILIAQNGPKPTEDGTLNISIEEAYEIYENNTFDNDTDACMVVFDYNRDVYKYTAGVFKSLEAAKNNAGNSLTYIADGKTVEEQSDGRYHIVEAQA